MDIALVWDPAKRRADLALAGGDLAADNGLTTSVILSLFCDRRAADDDVLPDDAVDLNGRLVRQGAGDRRGWWGDWYQPDTIEALRAQGALATPIARGTLPTPADRTGSRLWLLGREKETAQAVQRADDYVSEALQWIVDDGVAAEVDVAAEDQGKGALAFSAEIAQPKSAPALFRFAYVWRAQAASGTQAG
jgi:phage gp46-like protein